MIPFTLGNYQVYDAVYLGELPGYDAVYLGELPDV